MANAVTDDGHAGGGGNAGGGARPPRLPRWTPQELRVLIRGKNVAETQSRGRVHWASQPKWTAVSSYCRRHGVDRSPRQCRKRWDNLARDYKKIKVWEGRRRAGGGEESFWAMTNGRRREWRLPGYFDRVVYDMLDGVPEAEPEDEEEEKEEHGRMRGAPPLPLAGAEEEEGALFDSGRAAAEDGLFSDLEEDEEEEEVEEEEEDRAPPPPTLATPISERKPQQYNLGPSESGVDTTVMESKEQPAKNTEKVSSSREAHKRKRSSLEDSGENDLQNQLMEILERNSRTLAAHLEAQNIHWQLERDQRKDHTDRLVGVLSKLADALGRIADKLSPNGDAKI